MIEIWQFHIDKNYLSNWSNIIDIGGNVIYFIYLIIRFAHPNYQLPLNNTIFNINKDYAVHSTKVENYTFPNNQNLGDDKDPAKIAMHLEIDINIWIMLV